VVCYKFSRIISTVTIPEVPSDTIISECEFSIAQQELINSAQNVTVVIDYKCNLFQSKSRQIHIQREKKLKTTVESDFETLNYTTLALTNRPTTVATCYMSTTPYKKMCLNQVDHY